MQPRGVNELRKLFLDYFERNGHLILKSFSLVPHNDRSLLLINSGMAPLKPYFTGQEIPPSRRVATCQKCIRTGDIDNVGITARHGTFFEMLGNFSFGDYFKHEAIPLAWNFLTKEVGLDPERLYPSVYEEDDEAFNIWRDEMHIPSERIYRFGREDNFWEHGEGACGPCSEIYYDRGEKYGSGPEDYMGGDGDRFVEVWNIVFSQFNSDGKGHYTELEHKNIDTGMGLERLAMVVQDEESIYTVDTNKAILTYIAEKAGIGYHTSHESDISLRIITDHIKSATFMISDGIMPSNEGRGYVLRRIIRRAVRHGRKLGIKPGFMPDIALRVIELNRDGYPELSDKRSMILTVLQNEENNFMRTIDSGMEILTKLIEKRLLSGDKFIPGEDAFTLYDTYGFPLDLTEEILKDRGLKVDKEAFDRCMKRQRETARAKGSFSHRMSGAEQSVYDLIDPKLNTVFDGYDTLSEEAKITALTACDSLTEALSEGEEGSVITDRTPFYATKGGQRGDRGLIIGPDGEFRVDETIPLSGEKAAHVGVVTRGMIARGQTAELRVDPISRAATARNHSVTHLLQYALRQVLGDHVEQSGAYYDDARTRFDFTHFKALTPEEISEVEEIVNREIRSDQPVITRVMTLDDARGTGAIALFGEKYGDEVRVVSMGPSVELCGGTHVAHTGDIGSFKLMSEQGISAGVRRIEGLTSDNLLSYYKELETELNDAALMAKTKPRDLTHKISQLLSEIKTLRSENESLKAKLSQGAVIKLLSDALEAGGVKILTAKVESESAADLRNLSDLLREKLGESVVVLASQAAGKVQLIASATDGAVDKGINAGDIIRFSSSAIGGKGGGKPHMAQAGGTDPSGISKALNDAKEIALRQLKA